MYQKAVFLTEILPDTLQVIMLKIAEINQNSHNFIDSF